MAVPYVQRKIDVCDEMSTSSMVAAFYGNDLHSLLFHPIAGDSMQSRSGGEDPDMGAMLSMKQLQFGLLDPDMNSCFLCSPFVCPEHAVNHIVDTRENSWI